VYQAITHVLSGAGSAARPQNGQDIEAVVVEAVAERILNIPI
jgi:hypothetical protein